MKKTPIFCLITDFGTTDPYVGQVKCVLLSKNPSANVIDISHNVVPHNILHGSFYLISSWKYIPHSSITLTVVDPGVGTKRDILILKKDKKIVLAPDNGILFPLIKKYPSKNEIYLLNKDKFHSLFGLPSSTFHGRDIFAPLALYLSEGKDILDIAEPIKTPINKIDFDLFKDPFKDKALVIHIDRFGNCVLNIENKEIFLKYKQLVIKPYNKKIRLVNTYAELGRGEIGILDGSQGFLELALNQDNLAKKYNIHIGDKLHFEGSHD